VGLESGSMQKQVQCGMVLICRLAAPCWPPGDDVWQSQIGCCAVGHYERGRESPDELKSLVQWGKGNYE